jgi:hypothetical protein
MFIESAESAKEFAKQHRLSLALGAFLVSAVVSVPSFNDHRDEIVNAAPIIGAGVVTTEAMFVAGAATMAVSQKRKLFTKDLLNKQYIKESILLDPVDDSKLFRVGLATNTTGAIGTAVILGVGAVEALPNTMLPAVIALIGLDLAATATIRYNIYKGLAEQKTE